MRQVERASAFRIASDLVKADAIIDTREIDFIRSFKEKYQIRKEDEVLASSMTLCTATQTLLDSNDNKVPCLIDDFIDIAMSDDYCAKEEALLIIAIKICLCDIDGLEGSIFSIDTSSLPMESSQILYIESQYNNDINWEINESYREITTEIRLAGFDFVYLPKIAEHYRTISEETLVEITEFLYPQTSHERAVAISKQLRSLSTSEFCNELLAGKLGIKEFHTMQPSLSIKVGDSIINGKLMSNYLLLKIDKDILKTVRILLDLFCYHYQPMRLNYLKESKGRFVFSGFYKQVYDLFMLRKGVKSSVVVDIYRGQIRLLEADAVIEKLHRREKALYALFLLESASGGINFTKPDSPRLLEKYEKRMKAIQQKYRKIYEWFGGEAEKAPDLSVPEIRLPMIALIKRQIRNFGDLLYNVEDYVVHRNIYGNYGISLKPALCCGCDSELSNIIPLSDMVEWQRIAAL